MRAAIAAGELDDAERWAEQAATFAERMKLPAASVRAATACAEVLLARDDAAGAAAVAEEACARRAGAIAAARRWTCSRRGWSPAGRCRGRRPARP